MDLASRLALMPPGSLVPAEWALAELEGERSVVAGEERLADMGAAPAPPLTWRERLWIVPAETRIGAAEVCEAFGRPKSWLYRHTSAATIPHRKLDGELVFLVGEVRTWIRDHEEVVKAVPMESSAAERAGFGVIPGRRAS